ARKLVEHRRRLRARQAVENIDQTRQRAEGEQVGLGSVAHRRVTVTACDLLALDGTAGRIGVGCWWRWMQGGHGRTLHPKRLAECRQGESNKKQRVQTAPE